MSAAKPDVCKCVIWDLDNTLWEGVLLESDTVKPKAHVIRLIHALDERGILQSIASRGEASLASRKITEIFAEDIFFHPRITFEEKSNSVRDIAAKLDIGLNSIIFVDDDPYERAEVKHAFPAVRCIDAADLSLLESIADRPLTEFSTDARSRRAYYKSNLLRQHAEDAHVGNEAEFKRGLDMLLSLRHAELDDLDRLQELIVRTNQMNTSGRYFERELLERYVLTREKWILVGGYADRFGSLGSVAMFVIDKTDKVWVVELMLVSCRVIARGVGGALLAMLSQLALKRDVRLEANYIPNERNRIMAMTLGIAGFVERASTEAMVLELDRARACQLPADVRWSVQFP